MKIVGFPSGASIELDCAFLSESTLAKDWMRPEEDVACSHLQKPKGNGLRILESIRKNPFPDHLKRSAEEIQAQIEEERNSWNDDIY